MEQDLTLWQTKETHRGDFDGYTVMGFKYQNAAGEVVWHVRSWRTGFDPIHEYWVSGRDFRSASTFMEPPPYNLVGIEPITTAIEQDERNAVLKAIAEWENPTNKASNVVAYAP